MMIAGQNRARSRSVTGVIRLVPALMLIFAWVMTPVTGLAQGEQFRSGSNVLVGGPALAQDEDEEDETPSPEDEASEEEETPEEEEASDEDDESSDEESSEEDVVEGDDESTLGDDAVVLEDDMESERRGLLLSEAPDGSEDLVSFAYEDGEYVIQTLEEQQGSWWVGVEDEFGDVIVAVEAVLTEPSEDLYLAIGCRGSVGQESFDRYEFAYNPTIGAAALTYWQDNEPAQLDFVDDLEFEDDEFVEMELSCVGEEITASIDGEEILSVEDDTADVGVVYLSAGMEGQAEGEFEAHFDNLRIEGIEA